MFNLTNSATIQAPIKCVFDYMSTPENDIQWQHGTLATTTITNHRKEMGVYFRSIGHLMGRRNLGTYEVIESSANLKYQFRSIAGPLHSQTTYSFERAGTGTKVSISIQVGRVESPHADEPLLGASMRKELKENLAALKDLLEASPSPSKSGRNLPVC